MFFVIYNQKKITIYSKKLLDFDFIKINSSKLSNSEDKNLLHNESFIIKATK